MRIGRLKKACGYSGLSSTLTETGAAIWLTVEWTLEIISNTSYVNFLAPTSPSPCDTITTLLHWASGAAISAAIC